MCKTQPGTYKNVATLWRQYLLLRYGEQKVWSILGVNMWYFSLSLVSICMIVQVSVRAILVLLLFHHLCVSWVRTPRMCPKCSGQTLSIPRMIFPLEPHQKYYITQLKDQIIRKQSGGGLPYEKVRGCFLLAILFSPLRCTKKGMDQAFSTPKSTQNDDIGIRNGSFIIKVSFCHGSSFTGAYSLMFSILSGTRTRYVDP